ncbi:MAG TPA: zinc metalloprotease HtpX [Candidatus Polarisedimenticolia bacterium]|nr:zinc metalloprotease HtpX [Candidatus Polarisedimenticolia bacterium]
MYNGLKTAVLLGALTGALLIFGRILGGQGGMMIALIMAAGMNFFAYWFSDKMVLAMHGAKPVTREQAPELYAVLEGLTARAGIPMPRLYLVEADAPNAFATGRNPSHAAVAVTTGILRIMDRNELEGVLAHELSHVRNRDILISSVAATMAGAITMLATMAKWGAIFGGYGHSDRDDRGGGLLELLAMAIVAPLAAGLIQMAVSRSREYQADASGAELAGQPYGLASALQKLDAYSKRVPPLSVSPAMNHLYIANPLSGQSFMSLFSTHPPIKERVQRLLGR